MANFMQISIENHRVAWKNRSIQQNHREIDFTVMISSTGRGECHLRHLVSIINYAFVAVVDRWPYEFTNVFPVTSISTVSTFFLTTNLVILARYFILEERFNVDTMTAITKTKKSLYTKAISKQISG